MIALRLCPARRTNRHFDVRPIYL